MYIHAYVAIVPWAYKYKNFVTLVWHIQFLILDGWIPENKPFSRYVYACDYMYRLVNVAGAVPTTCIYRSNVAAPSGA